MMGDRIPMNEDTGDTASVVKSLLVDAIAQRMADGIAEYVRARHEQPIHGWDDMSQGIRNRFRAAVVAIVTDENTHPKMVNLLELVAP